MFHFFFFFQKAEKNRLKKKASWPKFCDTIIFFVLKIRSRPVDQQIDMVSANSTKSLYNNI